MEQTAPLTEDRQRIRRSALQQLAFPLIQQTDGADYKRRCRLVLDDLDVALDRLDLDRSKGRIEGELSAGLPPRRDRCSRFERGRLGVNIFGARVDVGRFTVSVNERSHHAGGRRQLGGLRNI